jgi:formylglycine-generating enzyme required for sulfatase activity
MFRTAFFALLLVPPLCAQALEPPQVVARGLRPGQVKVNQATGQRYVWIPPGRFSMGCSPGDTECFDNEKPAHEVTLTKGFWLGRRR